MSVFIPATQVVQEMNSKIPINIESLLWWSKLDDNVVNDDSGHGMKWTTHGSGISLGSGPLPTYVKSNSIRWII